MKTENYFIEIDIKWNKTGVKAFKTRFFYIKSMTAHFNFILSLQD